ncbi:MAG: biopolymer transporter ExbD [Candidatus Omnitrophota bacterium]|nr:biopolymer transporter ExbD [Candidatus Omnitrophota bacterium]
MKISGRRDYLINLESVAMTDIIMNMFIFFFISFSLLYTFSPERIQKLDIKLPEATNTAPLEDKNQVNIVLTGDGAIYLDKERVSISGLKDALSARRKDNPKLTVILRADKSVRFKQIVSVIDMLTELKVSRLSIAAVNEQK